MAKYYIGQKVRIIHVNEIPELLGREAIITGGYGQYLGYYRSIMDYRYVQGYRVHVFGDSRNIIVTEDEIEPVLPDGLESAEEINALYEPEPTETIQLPKLEK